MHRIEPENLKILGQAGDFIVALIRKEQKKETRSLWRRNRDFLHMCRMLENLEIKKIGIHIKEDNVEIWEREGRRVKD